MRRSLLLLLLLPVIAPVFAQAPAPLTVRVLPGLQGRFCPRHWNPAVFEITNPGPPLTALLTAEVQITSFLGCGGTPAGFYRLPVSLPTGLSRHPLPLYMPPYTGAIVVRLLDGGNRLLVEKTERLEPEGYPRQLTLVVTHRPLALAAVKDAVTKAVYVQPGQVPVEGRMLDVFDLTVLDDVAVRELPAGAWTALQQQVAGGGALVLTARFLRRNASTPELAAVTGAACGTASAAVPPASIVRTVNPKQPWHALSAQALACRVPPAAAVATAGQYPIVFERAVGRGLVRALAIDPEDVRFADVRSELGFAGAFWRKVLDVRRSFLDASDSQMPQAMVPPENRVEGLGKILVWYLAIFVVLVGPVNLIVLSRLRRKEWLIVTAPATAVVFLAVAVIIGAYAHRQGTTLSFCTVSLAAANLPGQAVTRYSGVASPGTSRHTMFFSDPNAAPHEFTQPEQFMALGGPPTYTLANDGRLGAEVRVPQWSMRGFSDFTFAPSGTLAAGLSIDSRGLSGWVENRLPVDLQHCYLLDKWNHVALGDLPRGRRLAVQLPLGPPKLSEYLLSRLLDQTAMTGWLDPSLWNEKLDTPRWQLADTLDDDVARAVNAPLLIGWGAPAGPAPLLLRPPTAAFQQHLYVFSLPVVAAGPQVSIPFGACPVVTGSEFSAFARLPLSDSDGPEAYDRQQGPAYEFLLPTGQPRLRHRSLTVAGYLRNEPPVDPASAIQLSLADVRSGAWVPVSPKLARSFRVNITTPERFIEMPRGLVRARLSAKQDCYGGMAYATWIDLAYEGEVVRQ